MTRAQYDAIFKLLPDLHDRMSEDIPPRIQDSIFKHLNLIGKHGESDEDLLMAHAVMYALYGFRPGGQTVAEVYARREMGNERRELQEFLGAIGNARFSIFEVVEPLPGQDEMQVRLRDELDPSFNCAVWFRMLAELHKQKSVAGLLVAGYVVPVFGGHMHVSVLLTVSEELLADATARKAAEGSKASVQAELTKFITRRALHEEMQLRDSAGQSDEV